MSDDERAHVCAYCESAGWQRMHSGSWAELHGLVLAVCRDAEFEELGGIQPPLSEDDVRERRYRSVSTLRGRAAWSAQVTDERGVPVGVREALHAPVPHGVEDAHAVEGAEHLSAQDALLQRNDPFAGAVEREVRGAAEGNAAAIEDAPDEAVAVEQDSFVGSEDPILDGFHLENIAQGAGIDGAPLTPGGRAETPNVAPLSDDDKEP